MTFFVIKFHAMRAHFHINSITMSAKRAARYYLSGCLVKIWLIKARLRAAALCADLSALCLLRSHSFAPPAVIKPYTLRLRENEPLLASSSAYFWSWHFYQILKTRENQPDLRQEPTHEEIKVNGPLKVHTVLCMQDI